eukprot:c11512_g1_i3.p1 GENE.c11512_g1_i3~~c11512_g1_i3.p1  ORF type:complete len:1371 (-),score=318.78 c11512_g1_i3:67-4179(-)
MCPITNDTVVCGSLVGTLCFWKLLPGFDLTHAIEYQKLLMKNASDLAGVTTSGVEVAKQKIRAKEDQVWGVCSRDDTLVAGCGNGSLYVMTVGAKPPDLHSQMIPIGFSVYCLAMSSRPSNPSDLLTLVGGVKGIAVVSVGDKSDVRKWTSTWNDLPGVMSIAASNDGELCVAGDAGGSVSIFQINHSQESLVKLRTIQRAHRGAVRCVTFCTQGDRVQFASGASDQTVNIWMDRKPDGASVVIDGAMDREKPSGFVVYKVIEGDEELAHKFRSDAKPFSELYRLDLDPERGGHTGGLRAMCVSLDETSLFTASDFDGIKVWDLRTHECFLEIAEPCTTLCLSRDGHTLFSSHGHHMLSWDWKHLAELRNTLQPVEGGQVTSQVSIVPIPHTWDAIDEEPSEEREDVGVTTQRVRMGHVCIGQVESNEGFDTELEQQLDSHPWLSGVFLMYAVRPVGSTLKPRPISETNRRLLAQVSRSCLNTKQVFLGPDPSVGWNSMSSTQKISTNTMRNITNFALARTRSRPDTTRQIQREEVPAAGPQPEPEEDSDALKWALKRHDLTAVELLLDLLGRMWEVRSMALIFDTTHFSLLTKIFPAMLYQFLTSRADKGVSELCLEQSPSHVLSFERAAISKRGIVQPSLGLEPHGFWEQRKKVTPQLFVDQGEGEKDMFAFRLGISGAVVNNNNMLNTILSVKSLEVSQKLFSLRTIRYLIRHEVDHGGMQDFQRQLVMYLVHLALFVSLTLVVAKGHIKPTSKTATLAAFCFLSTLRLGHREFSQVLERGVIGYLRDDEWNRVDFTMIILKFVTIILHWSGSEATLIVGGFAALLGWFKLLFYLRLYKRFAFLVRALSQILYDLSSFITILTISIIGFANAFYVLFNFDGKRPFVSNNPGADFSTMARSLLSVVAMMLGAFDEGTYVDLDSAVSWATTFLFLAYMIFVFIIMFNVVIAIISDTFSEVMLRSEFEGSKERTAMAVEINRDKDPSARWLQILTSDRTIQDERRLHVGAGTLLTPHRHANANKPSTTALITHSRHSETISLVKRAMMATKQDQVAADGEYSRRVQTKWKGMHKEFQIGELGVVPTILQLTVRSAERFMYEVALKTDYPCPFLIKPLQKYGLLTTGRFSPPSRVTLDDATKRAANIPMHAESFAVCYPLGGVEHMKSADKDILALTDPCFNFLLFGGFVYFDKEDFPIRCNAFLIGGAGLTFEGPRRWHSKFAIELHSQQRFCPITIEFFYGMGARYFAWINPGEKLRNPHDLEVLNDFEHGGFVYLFHDDPLQEGCEHDCYFVVAGGQPEEEVERRESSVESDEEQTQPPPQQERRSHVQVEDSLVDDTPDQSSRRSQVSSGLAPAQSELDDSDQSSNE